MAANEQSLYDLAERTGVAENLMEYLRSMIDHRHREVGFAGEAVVGSRVMGAECFGGLQEREKEFDGLREGKRRKVAVEMGVKKEGFVSDFDQMSGEKLVKRNELLNVSKSGIRASRKRRRAMKKLKKKECEEQSLMSCREALAEKERKVDMIIGALDERIAAVDEREKGFDSFLKEGMRELKLKEEQLIMKRDEFVREVKLAEERFSEQEKSSLGAVEKLEMAENKLERMREAIGERLKEIELRENADWENVAASVREAELIGAVAENQLEEFEKMKREFNIFQEGKMRELVAKEQQLDLMSKELDESAKLREEEFNFSLEEKMRELVLMGEQLSMKRDEFVREVRLTDEKLSKQEELRRGAVEKLEMAENKLERMRATMDERFKEIELRENVAWESVEASVKEAYLIREAAENQLEEFEKIKREFNSFQVDKMRELIVKEKQLDLISMQLVRDAALRDRQLSEREKLGYQLLKRLESAKDTVENLKRVVDERFKEISLRQIEVNRISDWLEREMVEVDSKQKKLEEQEERILVKEENVISKENELLGKEKELDLKEKNLLSWQKELEVKQREVDSAQQINEQRLKELDRKEKSVNSVKEFTRKCFKEYREIKGKLHFERDLVERRAQDLELKKQQLEHRESELKLKEREGLKLKPLGFSDVFDAHMKIEGDESVDLKFTVRMDGKTLQMFLNDPEKDLESMGDEIFEVLHLSSNPAKLVLDAMVGFYPPRLRKEDEELNVRRTCIALLEQLTKMSQNIQPHVRDEAIELASSWKSRMSTDVENPLEVLGFLHLVAAYDLAPYFDKSEVLSFLLIVAQHKQASELCCLLGFP